MFFSHSLFSLPSCYIYVRTIMGINHEADHISRGQRNIIVIVSILYFIICSEENLSCPTNTPSQIRKTSIDNKHKNAFVRNGIRNAPRNGTLHEAFPPGPQRAVPHAFRVVTKRRPQVSDAPGILHCMYLLWGIGMIFVLLIWKFPALYLGKRRFERGLGGYHLRLYKS